MTLSNVRARSGRTAFDGSRDFGRVLAAFEVPDEEVPAFKAFLDGLGYPYLAEFGNDAYRLFLQ